MTGKADFSEEEWDVIRGAPPLAGLMVVMAAKGGTFKESLAVGKAYGEARQRHGASQLLDAVAGSKPKLDHSHLGSPDELKQHALARVGDAVRLLEQKATPDEVDDYRGFVRALAEKVAEAHREDGVAVSEGERAALEEIASALGRTG
jgi:hypothetical protein